jgi:GNAT superfamily N-acetyltransferase
MSWLGRLPPQQLFTYERDGNEHEFWVHFRDHNFPEPTDFTAYVTQHREWPPANHAWYEVSVRQQPDGQLQTQYMANGGHPHLRGKGIGVALLPAIGRLLRRDIISSPVFVDLSQRRSPDATRVWKVLVELELASPEGDRFRLHADRALAYPSRRK